MNNNIKQNNMYFGGIFYYNLCIIDRLHYIVKYETQWLNSLSILSEYDKLNNSFS